MKIDLFTVGDFGANCYIISTESAAVMIDCGARLPSLDKKVAELGKNLKAILLTHGHSDHIAAVEYYRALTGAKVVISGEDAPALTDPNFGVNGQLLIYYPFVKCEAEPIIVTDGDRLTFGGIGIEVISTPGHSAGSVCYKIGDNLFSGDTLFSLSIGRTDFPDSDPLEMVRSLKKLMALDDDIAVYPGHGEKTEIGFERVRNPYVRGAGIL